MENNETCYYAMKKIELFKIWLNERSKNKKYDTVMKHVFNKIGTPDMSDNMRKLLGEKVRHFCNYLRTKWDKCRGMEKLFRNKNITWLNSDIRFKIKTEAVKATSLAVGRPEVQFCRKSEFGKRRAAAELSSAIGGETELLVRAAATSARKQGDSDLAAVLKKTIASPARPSKMKKLCSTSPPKPIPLTADEALAFFIENNFSKEQYNAIRRESKLRNCDIYPHYNQMHSKQIMENTVLPIGVFGETAAESRHKLYKADRLHHARKNSRVNNLLDVFNRAFDTSDPVISTKYLSRRMQQHKLLNLPPEVIDLLSSSEPTENLVEDDDNEENEILPDSSINILNQMSLQNELQLIEK